MNYPTVVENGEPQTGGAAAHCELLDRLCHYPDSACGKEAPMVRPEIEVRFQERSRMGRELHDSTAQILIALQLKVMYLKEMFDDPRYRETLAEVGDSLHELHREIRAVTFLSGLQPLKDGSLSNALRAMSERFGRLTGLDISFRSSGPRLRCSLAAESSLYRIAQEALANVFRHARARSIQLCLVGTNSDVRLIIKDDGVGIQPFRQQALASGVGLDSIRRRVRELDGRLESRRLKHGSRLSVLVPR